MAAALKKLLIFSFFVSAIFFVSVAVTNIFCISSDKNSFEDVLSTLSLDKARRFFINHPNSPYKDEIVKELIKWCDQENTKECYEMILSVIPENHVSYQGLLNRYKQNFDNNK
jgi:hypothetical protein